MNKLILRILLLPTFLWKHLGVDLEKLRLILQVKLEMDKRRPMMAWLAGAKKKPSNTSFLQPVVMMLMGAMLLVYYFILDDAYVAGSFYFFSLMCVLALMLISEFSTILLDTRDQFIIVPRPVDDRTFSVSRILHIGILLLGLLTGIALPGLIYAVVVNGIIAGALFVVQTIITGILTLLLVNLFYLMMMKWLSAQRLKDTVSIFQVVFSVAIFSSYYLGPTLLRSEWVQQLRIESAPATWLLPPVWIASLQQLVMPPFSAGVVVLGTLAVLAPLIALWLVVRIFAAGFNDKLAAMAGGSDTAVTVAHGAAAKRSLGDRLGTLFSRGPLESAGFSLVWLITGRSREFKQKVYPSLGFVPVYFVFLFFVGRGDDAGSSGGSLMDKLEQMREQGTFIVLFYLSIFTLMTVFQSISQSERFKAAWVYHAAPLHAPGELMAGVLKAVLAKFFYPYITLLIVIGIPLMGIGIINDALLAAGIGSIEALLIALFMTKAYPFSQPVKQGGGRFVVSLLLTGFVGLLGYVHYFFAANEGLVWGIAVMAWVCFLIMMRFFRKERWESLVVVD
ncbi:hypothetical protein [Parapedobacter sp. 10938]|uniref:hypothetical protein n=1 Tax=Parapedobacter flavus TaxID=3110225 RepID=UPI002DB8F45B|nr:hypothetical protein [Parapedobacter sp. 10938]MEC3878939.1 hypothetical protein [Parapedobacter sp. 10938]